MASVNEMIEQQLKARGITDKRVINAMKATDRRLFMPRKVRARAFDDSALPISKGQTISQPYIVAYMAEALRLQPADTVLEIGAGSGYHAAIVAQLVQKVYTIEIIPELADTARKNLLTAGIHNVQVICADGFSGLPEFAPFQKIYLTAATPEIPLPLKEQLAEGGLLLAPIQDKNEQLVLLTKLTSSKFQSRILLPVRFVPMTGKVQKRPW